MAKFVYRMQNILDLKNKLESEAKIELTIANNKLKQEIEKLEAIRREILAYEDILRGFGDKKLDILEIKRCNDAISIKHMEEDNQKRQILIAQKNVERAQQKLNEIMVERKTHETLREKAFEEFLYEISEEEKKEIDELVSYQYNNKGEGDTNG